MHVSKSTRTPGCCEIDLPETITTYKKPRPNDVSRGFCVPLRALDQMLIGSPMAARVASITPSERVGCGCTASMISCHVVSSVRAVTTSRSEEHTSELQSRGHLVCRLLLEKKK